MTAAAPPTIAAHELLRGRRFDLGRPFLPEGLARTAELRFLAPAEARFLSQVQGRTCARMFQLLEGLAGGAMQPLGLWRGLASMAAAQMPPGWRFVADPLADGGAARAQPEWATRALALHTDLASLAHYRASLEPAVELCPVWRDVLSCHWRQASRQAVRDEPAWRRAHEGASAAAREAGIDGWLGLVGAVDGGLQRQAAADAGHFTNRLGRALAPGEHSALRRALLDAYRWQYIASGVQEPRFDAVLAEMTTPAQRRRIAAVLAPILEPLP